MSDDTPESSPAAQSWIFSDTTLAHLRAAVPGVAQAAVDAITQEVPSYRGDFTGPLGNQIQLAVELALVNFLRIAAGGRVADPAVPIAQSTSAAYDLGRGEARSGRSMDALLAAYRVGARVSWRGLYLVAAECDITADTMGRFAELVFAYIDELSAASLAGHRDELDTTGRARERYREQLATALLTDPLRVEPLAERARWEPAAQLCVSVMPQSFLQVALPHLDARTLHVREAIPDLPEGLCVVISPCATPSERQHLLTHLRGRSAVVGQAVPWQDCRRSYQRALAGWELPGRAGDATIDTNDVLASIVLHADRYALKDLQQRHLAPLAAMRPSQRDRLLETLRAWALCHGRRHDMAQLLFVHPQTVHYRMNQLRTLLGDALEAPESVLALTIAASAGPWHEPPS